MPKAYLALNGGTGLLEQVSYYTSFVVWADTDSDEPVYVSPSTEVRGMVKPVGGEVIPAIFRFTNTDGIPTIHPARALQEQLSLNGLAGMDSEEWNRQAPAFRNWLLNGEIA